MGDINFKNIMDTLISNGVTIEQSVIDMINEIGSGAIDPKEWISTTYNFFNAVLSGVYETQVMELEIIEGILSATYDENFANQYIRNINFGGGI